VGKHRSKDEIRPEREAWMRAKPERERAEARKTFIRAYGEDSETRTFRRQHKCSRKCLPPMVWEWLDIQRIAATVDEPAFNSLKSWWIDVVIRRRRAMEHGGRTEPEG
jgi:hypothetical protein